MCTALYAGRLLQLLISVAQFLPAIVFLLDHSAAYGQSEGFLRGDVGNRAWIATDHWQYISFLFISESLVLLSLARTTT